MTATQSLSYIEGFAYDNVSYIYGYAYDNVSYIQGYASHTYLTPIWISTCPSCDLLLPLRAQLQLGQRTRSTRRYYVSAQNDIIS